MIDYHTHTYLCRHAEGTVEEYVESAVKKGLGEIGFADHFPLSFMDVVPKAPVTMEADEIDSYFRMVDDASKRNDIIVKTGIELDYIPGKTESLSAMIKEFNFDYIIGSLHFMDDWDFSHPYFSGEFEVRPLTEVYERYFDLICQACKSGLFDIVGHVDVIKKFGYRPPVDFLMPYYNEVANVLAETGICLEVNTAGLDAPVNEIYPAKELLEICIAKKVNIVLGSDAHAPEQVGRYFPETVEMLKRCGVQETVVFTSRNASYQSL